MGRNRPFGEKKKKIPVINILRKVQLHHPSILPCYFLKGATTKRLLEMKTIVAERKTTEGPEDKIEQSPQKSRGNKERQEEYVTT
jgi:hypothetical protein